MVTSMFVVYDLAFLILFTLSVVLFLYKHRSKVARQGLLYLYRTSFGIKLIDSTAKKYSSLLAKSRLLVIAVGYLLMASIVWMLVKFSWTYLSSATLARDLKIPVLMPLIPYLPELFKIDFLPPFYFTYWIIIIAVLAIPHEFFHGIYARLAKIKVHSTGFGFLGPFLAAFVEPDEKQMEKVSKKDQLAILASGTFANVIITILSAIVFALFFLLAFSPAGVTFPMYSASIIPSENLTILNSTPLSDIGILPNQFANKLIEVSYNKTSYFALQDSLNQNASYLFAIDSSPAFNSRLSSPILAINSQQVDSYDSFRALLQTFSPGDKVNITTLDSGKTKITEIILAEREGKAFLGIASFPNSRSGLSGLFYTLLSSIKDPAVYYTSLLGDFGWFIYNLLWWIILVSFSVALVNMLPVGMFDGGKFFYLTVLGITGSKSLAEKAFKITTAFLIALVALLMLKWVWAIVL